MPLADRDRATLITQVRYLLDEIDALEPLVTSTPQDILTAHPIPGEPSICELYALIGLYDLHVYMPALTSILAEERPVVQEGDDHALLTCQKWNDWPFSEILEFTRRHRRELLRLLESLTGEDWERTARIGSRNLSIADAVYGIVQHDADLLRAAAHRFHDIRRAV